ncbi:uncharacterized protein CG4449 [Vanessa cardui]|uniref:uncharacterized protein CG4449 n=1 Tax=Vanessa cardui TaxID=171605 RepID=UPI001F1327E3|nr:uncharacterized protein CG4449 [Vanessa cardui]
MSSSDSDDIYGDIGKRLDKIRRNFRIEESKDEDIGDTNKSSLNDSFLQEILDEPINVPISKIEPDNSVRLKTKNIAKHKGRPSKRGRKSQKSESSEISDLDDVVEIIDETTTTSRKTRSSSKRGVSRSSPRSQGTGRSRGKGRRGSARTSRGRKNQPSAEQIPIFSIGNTEEYPDELEDVTLFSSKPNTKEIVLDEVVTEENEELSVKVYWQSIDIYKFQIRKFQKFTQIFEHFAKKENVTIDKLLFTYNDIILKPDHTPDSIDYNIAKFIDGGIVNNSITTLATKTLKKNSSGIKIKFQYSKSKRPFEVYMERDDKLTLALTQCAEHLEVPLRKLKFEFDGDSITGSETLRDLDMEGDECIDVKIIS